MTNVVHRYQFRGISYRFELIASAAAAILDIDPEAIEDDEDLDLAIESIARGNPTSFSNFVLSLNHVGNR